MLSKKELLEEMDEIYYPMIKQISISDFTKCIAQFSGLSIQDVDKTVIKEYLKTWAKNKYRFFQMLGNQVRSDKPIAYNEVDTDYSQKMEEIGKDFPAYLPWLKGFYSHKVNKINTDKFAWDFEDLLRDAFSNTARINGIKITHFFKKYLSAPDELVTAIGRVFENQKIEANWTISIDPTDMMLASENPYGWESCYRLAVDNDSSHADGCLAAVLDDSSLITYIWNREGEFSLYDTYNFKKIRYKRIRQWISISPKMNAIHFNVPYPGKFNYPNDFCKLLREYAENIVCNYTGEENMWTNNNRLNIGCERELPYGYSEYDYDYIYVLSKDKDERILWRVFNEPILCPCGCGNILPGSYECGDDGDERYRYNGEGFIYENFEERYYCEYSDSYCNVECDRYNCAGQCSYWDDAHPVCDLDEESECENFDWNYIDDGIMCSNKDHCEGCPLWKIHHPDNKEEEEKEDDNDVPFFITSQPTTITYSLPNINWYEHTNNESES